MKVIIDTNIWISFLFGKALSGLVNLITQEQIQIISSVQQIEEILDVLKKPKISNYVSYEKINEIFSIIYDISTFVTINERVNICRDPKDNYMLDMAVEGNADCIITGDKDLLVLNPFNGTKIITYKEFEKLLI